jgi:thiol-disulfide isomerase/thioredoxin
MSCPPSMKVMQYATANKHHINRLKHINDVDKNFLIKSMKDALKELSVKDVASLIFNYFPKKTLEMILLNFNIYARNKDDCVDTILLDDANFETKMSSDNIPWIIKFYSQKCKHCVDFQPIWSQVPCMVSDEKFHVGVVEYEKGEEIAKKMGVESLPTVLIVNKDKVHIMQKGSSNLSNLVSFIENPKMYNKIGDDGETDCTNAIKMLRDILEKVAKNKQIWEDKTHEFSSASSSSYSSSSKLSKQTSLSKTKF